MEMEIKYNTQLKRWEVYGENSVIRAGERQPLFVAARWVDCSEFVQRAEVLG